MTYVDDLRAINEENFRIFAFWGSIMVIKILAMVFLIGRWRWSKRIWISPEDATWLSRSQVKYDHPEIERVRRAHLNDLENILPWALSTILWLTTSPETALVASLIKWFAISRIIHTIVYAVIVIPQPARFFSFLVGFNITLYQSIATAYHYYYYTQSV